MVQRRRASALAAVGLGLVLWSGPAGAVGPPDQTPAGTGGGCAKNGQAIASGAREAGAFGATVRTFAPIADENAAFFGALCSEGVEEAGTRAAGG